MKVKTQPYYINKTNAMRYSGDASNLYPNGTHYYKIKGTPTSTAIAVKVDNQWVKAEYVRKAPQHTDENSREATQQIEDTKSTKTFNIVPSVIIGLLLIVLYFGYTFRRKK